MQYEVYPWGGQNSPAIQDGARLAGALQNAPIGHTAGDCRLVQIIEARTGDLLCVFERLF